MAFYRPKRPLSTHISVIWQMHSPAAPYIKERVLPTGTVELVINLSAEKNRLFGGVELTTENWFGRAIVCGTHTVPFGIDTESAATIIGVHFKPGGAAPFFGLPIDELKNHHVGLDMLWGAEADALVEQLLRQPEALGRFRVLEKVLLGRLRGAETGNGVVETAVFILQNTNEPIRIAALASHLGWSQRHFSQVFREQVGISPKAYSRLQRFQRVLCKLDRPQEMPDWAALAATYGYYDQAHFIKAFQSFSGLTPAQYLRQKGRRPNHLPVLA